MGKKKAKEMKVTDLINQPPPTMQPQVPPPPSRPEPTEKSQIVITFSVPHPPTVMRFNTTKKGEKAYTQFTRAWAEYRSSGLNNDALYLIDADMFIATVDLSKIICIAYVDHAKRNKFIPA